MYWVKHGLHCGFQAEERKAQTKSGHGLGQEEDCRARLPQCLLAMKWIFKTNHNQRPVHGATTKTTSFHSGHHW